MKIKLLSIVIITLIISCSSNSSKLYETFYIGKNQYQYFIKEIKLDNENAELKFDNTLRLLEEEQYSTFNFTIESSDNIGSADELHFILPDTTIKIKDIDELFFEVNNDYTFRSSTKINFKDFIKIFYSDSFNIKYIGSNSEEEFELDKRANRKIIALRKKLLDIAKKKFN